MKKKINLQNMLDTEIIKLALSDVISFKELGHYQMKTHNFTYLGTEQSAGIYYIKPSKAYPFHSVALIIEEDKIFGFFRKYHTGFSFNDENKIFPMPTALFDD